MSNYLRAINLGKGFQSKKEAAVKMIELHQSIKLKLNLRDVLVTLHIVK